MSATAATAAASAAPRHSSAVVLVSHASAQRTAQGTMRRSLRTTSTKTAVAAAVSSTSSAYERASCEYHHNSGLKATSAAAMRPARTEATREPRTNATGIVKVPAKAES